LDSDGVDPVDPDESEGIIDTLDAEVILGDETVRPTSGYFHVSHPKKEKHNNNNTEHSHMSSSGEGWETEPAIAPDCLVLYLLQEGVEVARRKMNEQEFQGW